ncbi:glycosyltransferase family 4 protein [Mesorhizobium loti]|uniref:glycosyltransferase family 4 protein n=1 Tax=Rhizobium loti TaxID=381 RepID=UPI001FDAC23D|nr:glycosyltransferase family 4 protein [Mesorhizobium loti]
MAVVEEKVGDLARLLYKKLADVSHVRQRKRLVVPTSDDPAATPTVYFLTPDYQGASGGIRVIYRHVDILNSIGVKAVVLHQRPGFRCDWFDNQTEITDVQKARVTRSDILVVSELDIDLLSRIPSGIKFVIFNQNSHLTWRRGGALAGRMYGANPDLTGVVTVSDHNREMLRYAFPLSPIDRVHLSIDPTLFHPGSGARPRRIAYMPRRGRDDAEQIVEMLRARGVLDGWEVVALDGLAHSEVADKLRTTRIFLALTYQEGFGLPAAEAMACGNYVIGNHGFGGKEFFLPEFSAVVEPGDIMALVRAVEEAIYNDEKNVGWCRNRGQAASAFIHETYSPQRERDDVATFYREFLASVLPARQAAE